MTKREWGILIILILVTFFVMGIITGSKIEGHFWNSALHTSDAGIGESLRDRCEKEKIETLRNYDCRIEVHGTIKFKDGEIKDIEWDWEKESKTAP